MWAKYKQKSGFTIVELIITISVIAILAIISVVGYNGLTTRAENARTIDVASQWVDILNSYGARIGFQLSHSDSTPACLGAPSDYPATADFGAGICVGGWGNASQIVYDELAKSGSLSAIWKKTYPTSNFWGEKSRGIQYGKVGIFGVNNSQWIVYQLKGDVDCGLKTIERVYANSTTDCSVAVNLYID
jgi:prepilin-type N-terminal cleavage/methylation domain-containing protein